VEKKINHLGIIANPAAGRGRVERNLSRIKKFLEENKIPHTLKISQYPGHSKELVRELVKEKVDSIIAIGGDGTINEISNSILDYNVPLGLIPMGSGNDYAKMIYPDISWKNLFTSFPTAEIKYYDVGEVYVGKERFIFVNGLGIGFDAEVVKNLSRIKFLTGDLLYLVAVLMTFHQYRSIDLEIEWDDKKIGKKVFLFTVGCGKYLGGGFKLHPEADVEDGLFEISIIEEVGLIKFLTTIPKVFKGTHLGEKEVFYTRGKEVLIKGKRFNFHMDGELYTRPVEEIKVSVLEKALPLLIPSINA
jgi:YegS/Rv2252/BmrU family lipid kinase